MVKYFIAIDGGGTKTDVICADETGTVVGTGSSGPTNLTSTTVGAASFNLKEAIRQSIETLPQEKEIVGAAMGLAGLDTEHEYEIAYKTFTDIVSPFGIKQFTLVNDSLIALANGTDNPNAIILISGTGSICYGKNAAGQTAKTGGMDYLLTDQGSGYAIGRHVLREAVKSYDGRGPKTILEQLVCQHFGISSIEFLKIEAYNPVLSKIEVAELAQLCSQAYDGHDPVAENIFQWATNDLVLLAETVLKRLELQSIPTDVVVSGAVLHIDHVQKVVKEKIVQNFPQVTFLSPEKPPVYGALKLAMKQPK